MHFFFGDKKQQKKITNQLANHINSSLTLQFCQYCNKAPSSKIAFTVNNKIGFTCNNCELEAVGGDFKNLGQTSLLQNDKFSDALTKRLIIYQCSQTQPQHNIKQVQNFNKNMIKKSQQLIQKIKIQCNSIKLSGQQKVQQLIKQSQQQNSVFIFDQLLRLSKQKKTPLDQIKNILLKRALVNQNGLHFIDKQTIDKRNQKIQSKLNNLKIQTKFKFKQLNQLVRQINQIQI